MSPNLHSDPHERARIMIAFSSEEPSFEQSNAAGFSDVERSWLVAHLEACPACREFADSSGETIRSLRGIPITASARLVSATQMRVRRRAAELQRQQERLWVVCACCAAVTLSTVVTTLGLWRGFEWLGRQARLSAPVWESGFVLSYLIPAVVAGIFLLARGTFLADHQGSYQD